MNEPRELTAEDLMNQLETAIMKNIHEYYETWQLPIKFGHLFRRFNPQIIKLKTSGTKLADSLERQELIFSMQSPKNRRFIFPKAAEDSGEIVILDQLMTAEKNL